MMYVSINGGLGNQMFKYAFGRSVGLARKEEVVFHREFSDRRHGRSFGLDNFWVTGKFTDVVEGNPPWILDNGSFNPNVYTADAGMYYAGSWQSERYFNVSVVKREFQPRMPLSSTTLFVAEQIMKGPSAFIHVRRGDYLWASERFLGLTPMDYYERAMNYIRERKEHVTFYIFSDDMEWCRHNMQRCCAMVGHNKAGYEHEDMYLMRLCENAIIANSTFSWWGAWMGTSDKCGTVIAPRQWFADGRSSEDLVPKRWIRL